MLNTKTLNELNDAEALDFQRILDDAKDAMRPVQADVQAKYIKTEAPKLVEAAKKAGKILPIEDAEQTVKGRIEGGRHRDLYRDDVIETDRFGTVTVSEILKDFDRYDGATCSDPQEPELGRGKAKIYFNKKNKKNCIHSFAHGGIKYFLHDLPPGAEFLKTPAQPTYDSFIEWLESEDSAQKILDEWIDQTWDMPEAIVDLCLQAVSTKTGSGKRPLSKDLAKAQAARRKEIAVEMRAKKTQERAAEGRVELLYDKTRNFQAVGETSKILAADTSDRCLFRFGSELVNVITARPTSVRAVKRLHDAGEKYPAMPIINQLTVETLRHEIEKRVVFQKENDKGDVIDAMVPMPVIKGLMETPFSYEKSLTGIVEHPFIDEKFQPVLRHGYDPATGLILNYRPSLDLDYKFDEVSYGDLMSAVEFLVNEVFQDFPFEDEVDLVATIGILLTMMQRKMITGDSGCPGFLVNAPVQSSGKTTLIQVCSYAMYNRPAAATSFSKNDEEMGKHILGILREALGSVLFDNLTQGLAIESNELAMAMTSNTYSRRLLGENKTVTVPSSAVWLFTGNNVTPTGDFNTRILPIRLDPKVADPDRRRFSRSDIGAWVRKHRDRILHACMTLIVASQDIKSDLEPTRFPEWDRYVRFPLHAAFDIDIADLFQRNKNADPKVEGQKNFLDAWYNVFGSTPTTAKAAIDKARFGAATVDSARGVSFNAFVVEFAEATKDIFNGQLPSSLSLGRWLRGLNNRIIGEFRIESTEGTTRDTRSVQCWIVRRI